MPSIYDARSTKEWCDQETVGESFYRIALNDIRKHVPINEHNVRRFDATLVLEMDNPHSKSGHAISVRWQDRVIAHIPDSETNDYFPELARLAASGFDAGVRATLWTNETQPNFNPRDIHMSVHVGSQPPGMIAPINNPPSRKWAVIPRGRANQVAKEKDHLDVLQPYTGLGHEKTYIFVTLHKVLLGTRTRWAGVEVRLDGKRIGELSKTTGAKFLPIIEHYDSLELITVCHAYLRETPTSAEVTLKAATFEEMTDKDLYAPDICPIPQLVPYASDPYTYNVSGRYRPNLEDGHAYGVRKYSEPHYSNPSRLGYRQANTGLRANKNYTIYLLCLFFGGYLGLHYYYLGKIGKGVLYTCTAGLFMIGWIADILNPRRGFHS
jgi:TM2 domain protein